MRKLVAILLGAVVVLGACSFDELVDFVNTSGGSDNLTAPEQPKDVQAAGSTDVAKDSQEGATVTTELQMFFWSRNGLLEPYVENSLMQKLRKLIPKSE